MSSYPIEGTTVRFYTSQAFESIAGTAVNPDIVTFTYQTPGVSAVTYTWTNPSGDPTSHIVHDGLGLFHIDLSTLNLPGQWSYQWAGQPGVSGLDSTKTSAVFEGYLTVSNSQF